MKTLLAIFLFFPLLIFSQLKTENYSNGTKKSEGMMVDSMKTGVWKTWFENGQLADSGEYVPDKAGDFKIDYVDDYTGERIVQKVSFKTGIWVKYYDNGKIHSIGSYMPPLKKMLTDGFYTSANAVEDGPLLDPKDPKSLLTGKWKVYYNNENATLAIEDEYIDGVRTGTFTRYYMVNGKIQHTCQYVRGNMNGPYTEHYRNGEKMMEGNYVNGFPSRNWHVFASGVPVELIDTMHIKKEDSLDNKIVITELLRSKGMMIDSVKTGLWITRYENGSIADSGEYVPLYYTRMKVEADARDIEQFNIDTINIKDQFIKHPVQNGHWVSYYKNGKKSEEYTYLPFLTIKLSFAEQMNDETGESGVVYIMSDEQLRTGPFKTYYENGQLESEGFYGDGKKVGPYKEYYENGKLSVSYQIFTSRHGEETYDGEYKLYNEDGSISTENYYDKGAAVGVWKSYYAGGKIMSTDEYDGTASKRTEYYESGKLKRTCNYPTPSQVDGKYDEYYENGTKKYDRMYELNSGTGTWYTYYDDGKNAGESYMRKKQGYGGKYFCYCADSSMAEGDSIVTKYRSGKLRSQFYRVRSADPKVRDEKEKFTWWYENGAKKKQGQAIYLGQAIGTWNEWDEKGKLLKTYTYGKDGKIIAGKK